MREERYFFQGNVVLLFLFGNLYFYGLLPDLLKSFPKGEKELAVLIAVISAIALSPGIGYLLYSFAHLGFLLFGGWAGFYKRNNIDKLMEQAVAEISTRSSKSYDLDVVASNIFCTKESEIKYLEWIRRRMTTVFISNAMILYIFLTNGVFFVVMLVTNKLVLNNGLKFFYGVSLLLIFVLFLISQFEKKKAAEGFKFYFCRLVEADQCKELVNL